MLRVRISLFAIFGLTLLALGAAGCPNFGGDDDDDDDASLPDGATASENGEFLGEFSPDPDPFEVGDNSLSMHLYAAGGAGLEGAQIEIAAYMPAHGHGSSEEPEVEELGGGEYRATNIALSMPGLWELTIDVSAGGTSDAFLLTFDVE